MVTKEELIEMHGKIQFAAEPIHRERTKFLKEIENKLEELHKPLVELLEVYNDENLKDKNDSPVRIGDIITDGKYEYKVHHRGMQSVFGNMLFNPRVLCKKINPAFRDKKPAPNARVKEIHYSELKNFWIV
ncbi:hypothetical protein BAS06_09330 [Elizabethkingia miricola]|uniref:hypothetical protein n=1 Tax=Elizabethkingia miricola TaxID=172045 RepID=UPI00099966A7|nr:hypothetical protein [Elizabethkingia miricola]MCT4181619.1 hypothetical protein [Elizabethkingia anophelis]MDV3880747.1 hypothetical protein [Elizabethkingia anophelis]OPB90510.1 hypothetical protein BAS06_09330 [Elizabethkingia miricola]